jgi:hypothetical protein
VLENLVPKTASKCVCVTHTFMIISLPIILKVNFLEVDFNSKVILGGNSKHKSEHQSKFHHVYSVQIAVREFAMLTELSKYKSFSCSFLFSGPIQYVNLRISN